MEAFDVEASIAEREEALQAVVSFEGKRGQIYLLIPLILSCSMVLCPELLGW